MRNNFLCKTKHREHFILDSTELQTHCLDLVKTYRLYLNTSFTRVTVIMQFGNKIQAIAFSSPTVLNRIMAEYFWHDSTPIVQENILIKISDKLHWINISKPIINIEHMHP